MVANFVSCRPIGRSNGVVGCSFLARIESLPKQAREAECRFEDSERRLKASFSWKVTRPHRGIEETLARIRLPTRLSSSIERSIRSQNPIVRSVRAKIHSETGGCVAAHR